MSSEEVTILNRKVDRILDILNNHDETNEKGLVTKVSDLTREFRKFVHQYDIDQAIKKGKATVWNIVWGAVGAFIIAMGKFLISLIPHA